MNFINFRIKYSKFKKYLLKIKPDVAPCLLMNFPYLELYKYNKETINC